MHSNTGRWLNAIMAKLFEAEDRRLDRIVSDLNRKNCEARGRAAAGFFHQGIRFIPLDQKQAARANAKQPLVTLVPDLTAQAESLILDFKQTDDDKTQIRQLFVRLLDPCMTTQEIRDALPECVIPLVPELEQMPRRFAIGWSIHGDPRALRQYTKLISKIEMYAVSRMLY